MLGRNEYLVRLENADIRVAHRVAVCYFRKMYIARFGLQFVGDYNLASVQSGIFVAVKFLSEYIVPPDKFLRVKVS